MRTIITMIGAMLLTIISARGQLVQMQAYAVSFKDVIADTDWQRHYCDLLIIVNFDKRRITVYSEKEQVYDIVNLSEPYIDSDGVDATDIRCIDQEGKECMLQIFKLKGKTVLQVVYPHIIWAYAVQIK